MKILNTFLIAIIFLVSCSKTPSKLDLALTLADDNRIELEKVLEHYSLHSADSLKFKAARFLIENMIGHYSYSDTAYYKQFYTGLDSIAHIYKNLDFEQKESMFKSYLEAHTNRPRIIIQDVKIISSTFLIDNIERSFKVWEESEWAQHVDFDQFCEYILPYKIRECQELDNWREYFEFYCDGELRTLQYCELFRNSAYDAYRVVNQALDDSIDIRYVSSYDTSVKKMILMPQMPFGLCDDYSALAVSVLRAKGIPCAIDFTPQWPFRSLGHSWCVLLRNSGKYAVFEGIAGRPALPHKEDHKMAKVFRRNYAINDEILAMHRSERSIPDLFRQLHIKDVTNDYMECVDVHLNVERIYSQKFKYAYLTVFNNKDWAPIHWGKINGKKITFEKMGKNILYLPVFYENDRIKPFTAPFILTVKGETKHLNPDTINRRSLTLTRKYPPFPNTHEFGRRAIGGRFEAANNPDFNNSDTIYTVTDYGVFAGEIKLDSIQKKYRYWRYYSPDGSFCTLAELYFFEKDSINSTIGKILGTDGSFRTDGRHTKKAVFDRDALTFFDAPYVDDAWVGMDFGKPVQMDRIVYLHWNDGNCIEIGDEYELFYWIDNCWKSLGQRKGNGASLYYEDCPHNALFLLRNYTKGVEERVFTYEDGRQVWW